MMSILSHNVANSPGSGLDLLDLIDRDEELMSEYRNEEQYEPVDWFDKLDTVTNGMESNEKKIEASEDDKSATEDNFKKKRNFSKMGTTKNHKEDELVALQYRKAVKSKTTAKFQIVTQNVFPSCACKGTKNGCKTKACTCVLFDQECQPTCGCRDSCPNMDITRGEGKQIRIGASEVHGEGCFTEEDVKKGEFIGEYTGEIVARAAQDKKKKKSLFLFETGDKDFLLDASRFGSELSKMNHRMERRGANCEFKMKRVAGQWRVGVWALKDMGGGQELFANYGFKYRGHGLITPYTKKISLSDVN